MVELHCIVTMFSSSSFLFYLNFRLHEFLERDFLIPLLALPGFPWWKYTVTIVTVTIVTVYYRSILYRYTYNISGRVRKKFLVHSGPTAQGETAIQTSAGLGHMPLALAG